MTKTTPDNDYDAIIRILKSGDHSYQTMVCPNGPVIGLGDGIYLDFNSANQFEGARHED